MANDAYFGGRKVASLDEAVEIAIAEGAGKDFLRLLFQDDDENAVWNYIITLEGDYITIGETHCGTGEHDVYTGWTETFSGTVAEWRALQDELEEFLNTPLHFQTATPSDWDESDWDELTD